MKTYPFFTRLSLCLCFVLFGSLAWATTSKDFVFINNTGRDVNDLHIQFDTTVDFQAVAPKASSNYLGSKFRRIVHRKNEGRSQVHFINRGRSKSKVVQNGQAVWGRFSTDAQDLHILSWCWTFNGDTIGNVMQGDLRKTLQSNSLVVPGVDVVTELEFENKIYKGRPGQDDNAVVNDLHIVSKVPATSINEGTSESVFQDANTTHCPCSNLPAAGRERKLALKRMNEPCKSLCENSRIDLYVINLSNPSKNLPPDTKIPVKLRANDKVDVLEWWFTQDGFPLRFREGRTENGKPKGEPKRDGEEDEPLKLGKNDQDSRFGPGGTLEDKGEAYNISHTSYSPPTGKSEYVFLDLRGSVQQSLTTPGLNLPSPDLILEILLNEQLNDELKDFAELLPLEGSLSDTPSYWAGFDASLGIPLSRRWHLSIEAGRAQGTLTGKIPFLDFRTGTSTTIDARWEAQIRQEEYILMIGYEFIKGLQATVGGFKGRQRLLDNHLTLRGRQFAIPLEWDANTYGMVLQLGSRLPLAKGLDWVFNAKLKGYLQQDKPAYRPELNMGIRLNLIPVR